MHGLADDGVGRLWCHLDRGEELGQEVHRDDLSLGLVLGLKVLDPLPGAALGLVEQVPAAGAYLSMAETVSSEEASSVFT